MFEASQTDWSAEPLAALPVFSLGGATFTVADAIRAAHFRGEVAAHAKDLQRKMTCHEHAVANDLVPDAEVLQSMADQFRYSRDLISADDTDIWMHRRGIDEDAFSTHLLRMYWSGELAGKIPAELHASVLPHGDDLVRELILNGAVSHMARKLAWRMAGHRASLRSGDNNVDLIEEAKKQFFTRTGITGDDLGEWLASHGGDLIWFQEMLSCEAAYAQIAATVVTEEGLARALRSRRLELMQLVVEEIEFDSLPAAREAVLCIRQDGLSMEEVAHESRFPYFKKEFVLEELPEDWKVSLLSTPENGLVGPLAADDLFHLFRVLRKVDPDINDPLIRRRLADDLVDAYYEELCSQEGLKILI